MLGFVVLLLVVSTVPYGRCEYDLMAFTLGQDAHQTLTDASPIKFSMPITNYKMQSLQSSVFTCTKPGPYKFQAYSLTRTDKYLALDMYQNDAIVASLWAHTPQDYAAAGNAVILDLATGDTVQVKSHTNSTVDLYGTQYEIYTTFSGVQLGAYQIPNGIQLAAFSVALTQHLTVPGGDTVVYNKAYVDTENAFNMQTGIFTAPNGGIYYIHLFGLARQDKELWLELYHNTQYVCSIYGLTKGEWADAGNTVVLHLRTGDTIQVKARVGETVDLYGDSNDIYSIFSAYELYGEKTITSTRDGPKSYFSVGLANMLYVKDGYKVVMDRIITDSGDYNHVTGEFVAPVFGTYEFNYHALGENTSAIALDLYHSYRYINSLYTHTPIDYGAAGNSAVLEMDKGDTVYLRANGDNSLYGGWDEVYCTFSGTLLHSSHATKPVVG